MLLPAELPKDLEPDSMLEWVDAVADRFEAEWRASRRPCIADYLGDTIGKKRQALIVELARIDLERRRKAGEARRWSDYLKEFPELQATKDGAADSSVSSAELSDRRSLAAPSVRLAPRKWPAIQGYEILAELGHGGMGSVYKARQRSLKRLVALKLIQSAAQADSGHLARFRIEAEAAARLQHPNIVQIYEVGQQDGVPYLALEYVDGGSLAQQLTGKPRAAEESAQLIATLAQAMQYAHEHGVVHRDLKPANILLQRADGSRSDPDPAGPTVGCLPSALPKIADFGLAKLLEDGTGQTVSGAIIGTPSYMAPEQADAKPREIGPATDVYALGAILYEMLTGRPPFRGDSVLKTLEQVRTSVPVPPSRLLAYVPKDVETICLKCLAHAPERRYASAGALAEDLLHFLRREPIQARRVSVAGRLWRWGRRHPARAGLLATGGLLIVTLVVASTLIALASSAREHALRREGLIHQLQLVEASAHVDGWSDESWKLTRDAAALRKDTALRALAAAACTGLDAQPGSRQERASVSSLAFGSNGAHLLLGGRNDGRGQALEGAKVWDLATGRLDVSRLAGPGPVAYRSDGVPMQLVPGDRGELVLWDLAKHQSLGVYRFDSAHDLARPSRLEVNELGFPVLALTRTVAGMEDCRPVLIAASYGGGAGAAGAVVVWDARTCQQLFQARQHAGALAFAPSGLLLAAGDGQGRITLWSVPDGKRIADLATGRVTVHCLAFSPDGEHLAVGDSAGAITVWGITSRLPITYCQGSHHDVYAVAFSPDGTLLVSGGRGPPRLWDAATGRLLLTLRSTGFITALEFAPDGDHLAVGSKAPASVCVWNLNGGRGVQTLRGLTSQASHLCFSADGRMLAALGHNWQVAIWDLEVARLRLLLPCPKGNADDDAGMAFSPDGRRFACVAGEGAKLWDLETGKELGAWALPRGIKDLLTFHPSGALLLFREEKENSSMNAEPGDSPPPGVCQLRNLLGSAPSQPVASFSGRLLGAMATHDGNTIIVESTHQTVDGQRRTVKAYDALTGGERWQISSTRSRLSATLSLDPSGGVVAIQPDNQPNVGILVDVSTGRVLRDLEPFPLCLSPGPRELIQFGTGERAGERRGFAVFQPGDLSPRMLLGIETMPSFPPVFSRDGSLLAWSSVDGTVSVCNLSRLRDRLLEIGLEW
jgi:serine/threonine protein kinase/WD40 repeat protein